jgi:DNA-binding MarR family transcriptional regulator
VERSLLDSPSYQLIRVLGRHKALVAGGLDRHGLAGRTGVSAPAVTKVVSGLERTGLVRRERDASDARLVRIWLTDAGRALREPVTRIWYDSEREFWAGLSDDERIRVREAVGALLGR